MSSAAVGKLPSGAPGIRGAHEHLDGLRGLLCAIVILTHVFFLASRTAGEPGWWDEVILWCFPQVSAVALFVVISGYCLMLPVAHSNLREIKGGIVGYLRRRFRRILPPYYVALGLCLLHIHFFRPLYNRVGQGARPVNRNVLLSHVFLYYNWKLSWRFQINGSYWSLAPEWQLYLLFPLILVPCWRRFGEMWTVAAAAVLSGGLMLLGPKACDMHPWYVFLFTCGMAAAALNSSSDRRRFDLLDRMPWGGISKALFGAVLLAWPFLAVYHSSLFVRLPPIWPLYFFLEMTMSGALIAAMMHWSRAQRTAEPARWPLLLRVMNRRVPIFLGRISYSLYLIHWPVLVTVIALVRGLHRGEGPTLVLAYLTAFPISLGCGYLLFLAVESRFLPSYVRKTPVLAEAV